MNLRFYQRADGKMILQQGHPCGVVEEVNQEEGSITISSKLDWQDVPVHKEDASGVGHEADTLRYQKLEAPKKPREYWGVQMNRTSIFFSSEKDAIENLKEECHKDIFCVTEIPKGWKLISRGDLIEAYTIAFGGSLFNPTDERTAFKMMAKKLGLDEPPVSSHWGPKNLLS